MPALQAEQELHAPAFVAVEKDVPATQAPHVASDVVVHALDTDWPAAHTVHGVHDGALAVVVKPVAQLAHWASADAVQAVDT